MIDLTPPRPSPLALFQTKNREPGHRVRLPEPKRMTSGNKTKPNQFIQREALTLSKKEKKKHQEALKKKEQGAQPSRARMRREHTGRHGEINCGIAEGEGPRAAKLTVSRGGAPCGRSDRVFSFAAMWISALRARDCLFPAEFSDSKERRMRTCVCLRCSWAACLASPLVGDTWDEWKELISVSFVGKPSNSTEIQ